MALYKAQPQLISWLKLFEWEQNTGAARASGPAPASASATPSPAANDAVLEIPLLRIGEKLDAQPTADSASAASGALPPADSVVVQTADLQDIRAVREKAGLRAVSTQKLYQVFCL
jgi:hypothetical protein